MHLFIKYGFDTNGNIAIVHNSSMLAFFGPFSLDFVSYFGKVIFYFTQE